MSKHILVVSQYFYPEPFRINDICTEWVRRGYRVTVLTGIPNYPEGKFYPGYSWLKKRRENWNGVEIIRIPLIPRGHNPVGLVFNYFSFVVSGFFWKTFTKIKADYVFTFGVSPMTQALVGVWYAKRRKIPHDVYVQDLWPENVQIVTGIKSKAIIGPINRMVDYIYKNSKKILVTSPSFEEVIKQRVDAPDKVLYWPQYAEEFYCPQKKESVSEIPDDGKFKIIFTGNVGYAQGLDILPKTAKLLKQQGNTSVSFVLVGDGRYKEKLQAEIQEQAVSDMFIMVDRQPAQRIPKLLAACDAAFISFMADPLFEKTIPAKLQSYMACGMPIVAAATGETARIVEEADCGACCPTGDEVELAKRITDIIDSEDLTHKAENARRYFLEHFEKQRLMDMFEERVLQIPN